jgi:hypothetical protein
MIDPVNKTPLATGTGIKPSSAQQPAANSRSSSAQRPAAPPQETIALSHKAQFAHDVAIAARRSDGIDSDRVRAVRTTLNRHSGIVSPAEIARAVSEAILISNK